MPSIRTLSAATLALSLTVAPAALAQTSSQGTTEQQERIGAILVALSGDLIGDTTSVESQWAMGQTPLRTQQSQFNSRVDADIRARALDQATGLRLKRDYAALVELEARYGADRRFTDQERAELTQRYGALTQALADGQYTDDGYNTAMVADGRVAFDRRVDAAVAARRLPRTEGTRLKYDYAQLVQIEAGYLRDGQLTTNEKADRDARLDQLDARVGDVGYGNGTAQTPRARLDNVLRALPYSGLSASAQTQLRVEQEDLNRLAAAYERVSPTAEERAYLDRRIGQLETTARVRR